MKRERAKSQGAKSEGTKYSIRSSHKIFAKSQCDSLCQWTIN